MESQKLFAAQARFETTYLRWRRLMLMKAIDVASCFKLKLLMIYCACKQTDGRGASKLVYVKTPTLII